MKLFYFVARYPDQLRFWFLLETGLIFINYVMFFLALRIGLKTRVHINLKIIGVGISINYFLTLTARLIIIFIQIEAIKFTGPPEEFILLIAVSWLRNFSLGYIVSVLFWIALERQAALYFVNDYEQFKRLWITLVIVVVALIICSLGSTAWVFEWTNIYYIAIFGVSTAVSGVALFFHSLVKTQKMLNDLRDSNITSNHRYSLSLRLQLEEILWCGQLIKRGFIVFGIVNITTFAAFVLSNSDQIRINYGEGSTQLCECLFNILIAANGSLMGIPIMSRNEYLIGILKSMFCKPPMEEDETTRYFNQLRVQWEMPPVEPRRQTARVSGI